MVTKSVVLLAALLLVSAQAWSSRSFSTTTSCRIHQPSPTTSQLLSASMDDNDSVRLTTSANSATRRKSIATETWSERTLLSQDDYSTLMEEALVCFGSSSAKQLIAEIVNMRQSSNNLQPVNELLDALLDKPYARKYPIWARIRKLSRFSKRARLVSLRRTLDAVVEQQSSTSSNATSRRRALLSVLSALSAEASTMSSSVSMRGSAIASLEKWVRAGHSLSELVSADLVDESATNESTSATSDTTMHDRGQTIAQKKLLKTVAEAISVDEIKQVPGELIAEEKEEREDDMPIVHEPDTQRGTKVTGDRERPENEDSLTSTQPENNALCMVDMKVVEAESILKDREIKQSQAESIVKNAQKKSEAERLLKDREAKQAQAETIVKNAKMQSEAKSSFTEREEKQSLASEIVANAKRKSQAEKMQAERQAKQSAAQQVMKVARMKAEGAELQSIRQSKQAKASEMIKEEKMKSEAAAVQVEREEKQAKAAEMVASPVSASPVTDVESAEKESSTLGASGQVEDAKPAEVGDLLENVLQDVWSMEDKAKTKIDESYEVELPKPVVNKSQVQPAKRDKQVRHSRKSLEMMAKKLEEKSQSTEMTLEDKTYQVLKDLGLI